MFPVSAVVSYSHDGLVLTAKVIEHVEGWYRLEFSDGTRRLVRPSRVVRKK